MNCMRGYFNFTSNTKCIKYFIWLNCAWPLYCDVISPISKVITVFITLCIILTLFYLKFLILKYVYRNEVEILSFQWALIYQGTLLREGLMLDDKRVCIRQNSLLITLYSYISYWVVIIWKSFGISWNKTPSAGAECTWYLYYNKFGFNYTANTFLVKWQKFT